MGIGDAMYMQSIAKYLKYKGVQLEICTKYPELFPLEAKFSPFRRKPIDYTAHYTTRKHRKGTSQFVDMCLNCGITDDVDLVYEWTAKTNPLPKTNKKILIVQQPRPAFGRTDGFGRRLLPKWEIVDTALNQLRDQFHIVQIGNGESLYHYKNIDTDLTNKTSVEQLLDIGDLAHAFIGQCSYIIPLAESFNKPIMVVWSNRVLSAKEQYIKTITPDKILHKQTSQYMFDEDTDEQRSESIKLFAG